MFTDAGTYQQRLIERHEQEVAVAQSKITDNSEYSRYLKVARHSADCAQFESVNAQAKEVRKQKDQQEDKNYKQFLDTAVVRERGYKSAILEKAARDAKVCAGFNETVHREKQFETKFGTEEKMKELAEAKYFHQTFLDDEAAERVAALQKQQETKEMYENFLSKEEVARQKVKLEAKMAFEEELAVEEEKFKMQEETKAC